MKRQIFLILLIFMTVFLSSCTKSTKDLDLYDEIIKRDELIVGVKTDAKPFGYIDKEGKNAGLDVDIAKVIAKSILGSEDKIKFVPVTASNRIMKLNTKEVDMVIATMSATPARMRAVNFSKTYYMAGQALIVQKQSKITSLRELNGKKVIVIYGTTAEKNVRSAAPEAIIQGYKTYEEGVNTLKAGKADALSSDDTILIGYVLKDKSLILLSKRYSKEPYAIAFRKDNASKKLNNVVDSVLETMLNDGTLIQLKHKWLSL